MSFDQGSTTHPWTTHIPNLCLKQQLELPLKTAPRGPLGPRSLGRLCLAGVRKGGACGNGLRGAAFSFSAKCLMRLNWKIANIQFCMYKGNDDNQEASSLSSLFSPRMSVGWLSAGEGVCSAHCIQGPVSPQKTGVCSLRETFC